MEGTEGSTREQRRRQRRNGAAGRAGRSAGRLLLLGVALAAAATLAVALIARAAAKRKKTAKKTPPAGERCGRDSAGGSAERAGEGGVREGCLSLFPQAPPPPPPPVPLPPSPASRVLHRRGNGTSCREDFVAATPLPEEEEEEELERVVAEEEDDSSSGHDQQTPTYQDPDAVSVTRTQVLPATVNGDVLVGGSNLGQAQEKIIEESTSIDAGQGQEEQDSLIPVFINKDVVIEESKVIQVVQQVPEEVVGSAGRERDASTTVEEGTNERSKETRAYSMEEAAGDAEVVLTSKAVERIRSSKLMAVALEPVFHVTGGGQPGDGEAEVPVKEKREGGDAAGIVEARETTEATLFSKTARVFLLMSTLVFLSVLTAWIHHYSKRLLESSHL